MRGRRPAGLLLALLLVLLPVLLGGCEQPSEGVIRFGLAQAPASLDPRFATDAASARINRLIYRRLVDFDAAARPVPALARWERLGPRHYRFHLGAQGRRFHDGTSLTAADVAATYRAVLDPATASPHRGALAHVSAVRVVDADTVDFQLARADPMLPALLTVGIMPARLARDPDPVDRAPVGSGPFRLLAWPVQDRLLLERLRDGQRVRFLRVADPTMRALKLARGEIDLLQNDLPAELVAWLEGRAGIDVRRRAGGNFSYLGFNLRDPVSGRKAVRAAVAHALDRPAIIRHLFAGAARPAAALLPPEHWAGHPGLAPRAHDPARARRLLRAAGYDAAHPARLTYKTSNDPFRVRLATVIQHQLAEVGIEVELRTYDWGTFYGDIKAGRFQLYSLTWVGIKSPDIFRYAFHSDATPPGGANRGGWDDALTDRLIAAAEATDTRAARAARYRRLQERLWRELPYVPLWYEHHVAALRADITGYALAADGNYDGLMGIRRRDGGSGG